MAEESTAPPPAPVPAPVARCFQHADIETTTSCALCKKPICDQCENRIVLGSKKSEVAAPVSVCPPCCGQILSELKAELAGPEHVPLAVVGGLVGALVGGGVWAAIAILANVEVGYVAVGIGFLAGLGVSLGASRKKGISLQIISALSAVLGLVIGKYFAFAHAVMSIVQKDHAAAAASMHYWSMEIVKFFPQALPEMLSGFDLLWIFLALGVAWRMPARTVYTPGSGA